MFRSGVILSHVECDSKGVPAYGVAYGRVIHRPGPSAALDIDFDTDELEIFRIMSKILENENLTVL